METATAGTTLGRYQVVKHLASGGMAQVLLARSAGIEGFERHVVIKRIHRERVNDESSVKMFLDEARLAAALHHANIVQVHDIGQENGEYFFAMEYIHGEDLRRLLTEIAKRGQQIPVSHVVSIVGAAASALHYAHEFRGLGIVHRDVSPANILLGYDGTVKVVDFGIAKAALRSQETQSGTLKGKISYMAPEQCMGQSVDRRSDVFALGIVLYELLTARRLFKGSSDFLTMSQIVAGNIPNPMEHRPDLPPRLTEITMKALALDPAARYQTAEDLRLALDASGSRSSTSELADYMRKVFGRRVEPWLADDDEPEIQVDVDFDGGGTGVAGGPDRMMTPPPGSLLARARRKVAPVAGIPLMPIAPVGTAPTPSPLMATATSTSGTGTPMAWPTAAESPQKKRLGLVVGLLGLAAAAAVAVMMLSNKDGTPTSAAPSTTPARVEPAPEPAKANAAEPPQPAQTEPAKVAEEPKPVEPEPAKPAASEPANKEVAAKAVKKTAGKKTGKKGGTKKTGTKTDSTKWDPTNLMP